MVVLAHQDPNDPLSGARILLYRHSIGHYIALSTFAVSMMAMLGLLAQRVMKHVFVCVVELFGLL